MGNSVMQTQPKLGTFGTDVMRTVILRAQKRASHSYFFISTWHGPMVDYDSLATYIAHGHNLNV